MDNKETRLYELNELTEIQSDDLLLVNKFSDNIDYKIKSKNLVPVDVIKSEVDAWLDKHPEATTTVEDDSLTTAKYKNKSVTLPKLGDDVTTIFDAMRVRESLTEGAITTFSDGAKDVPMDSLVVGVEPKQDLHGYDHPWVGGAGKNKCNANVRVSITQNGITSEIKEDNTIVISGTSTGNGDVSIELSALIEMKAGQTYTISFMGTDTRSGTLYIFLRKAGAAGYIQIPTIASTQHSITYTPNADMTVTEILFRTTVNNSWTGNFKIQVELGSTATSYEPYSNICHISGHTEANVTSCGKNLFDKTKATVGKFINSQGVEIASGQMAHSDYIRVKSNTTYYTNADATGMFFIIALYDENKNFMRILNNASPTSFNTLTASYVIINTAVGKTSIDDMYVIEGSEAIAYEPYNGQTYNIQFKDGDNPLTVYGGSLDVVSGELVVDRAEITFNGSENWIYTSTLNLVYINIPNTKRGTSGSILPIQSNLLYYSQGNRENYGAYINDQGNLIVFAPNDITDANTWKTWLASNNVQVVYELATPITYQLTPTQVKSLLGTNNVWTDCGDVKSGIYTANIKLYIDKKLEN